jgi:hypothetical protein
MINIAQLLHFMKGGSHMAIITISRQFGSLGTEIAKKRHCSLKGNSVASLLPKIRVIFGEHALRMSGKNPCWTSILT